MARSLDAAKLAEWQKRLVQFKASGLTVLAFCRQESVSPAQFYYWLRRVQGQPNSPPSTKNSNTVPMPTPAPSQSVVEVLLGDNVRVRLPTDDRDLVHSVVSRLQSSATTTSTFQRFDLSDAVSVSR